MTEKLISCNACGSNLKFDPATSQLTCDRCGAENEIIEQESELHLKELSFDDFDDAIHSGEEVESQVVKCKSCGAEFSVDSDSDSGESDLDVALGESLLPLLLCPISQLATVISGPEFEVPAACVMLDQLLSHGTK